MTVTTTIEPVLKYRPADFVVREVIIQQLVDKVAAAYRLLLLRKCGYTTFEAVRLLADRLGIPAGEVTYGGLKDEDAITEQLVAVPVTVDDGPVALIRDGDRWMTVSAYGYVAEALTIGGLVGNAFRIVVRNLVPTVAQRLAEDRKILAYTVNYYGIQRFGVPGGPKRTHLVGAAMLDGEWAQALSTLVELKSPESAEAAGWTGDPLEYFSSVDPRRSSFYLAAHESFEWNARVRALGNKVFERAGRVVHAEGIEFLYPATAADAVRLMGAAGMLPYTRYDFTDCTISSRESVRNAVLQTTVGVFDHQSDEAHPGRDRVTLDFFLPSGCYATATVEQLINMYAYAE